MTTAIAENHMATKRIDVTVKLDAAVVRDAKAVASFRDVTLAAYLSEMIRPLVDRDLDEEFAKRGKAQGKLKSKA